MKAKVVLLLPFILLLLCGCAKGEELSQPEPPDERIEGAARPASQEEPTQTMEDNQMKIQVQCGERVIVYALNDSSAAKDLYAQLPLTLEVKDFSTNEKTFYPPEELDVSDAPMADAAKGSLCYYAPWADVVMFYDHFGKGSSLYALGEVIFGKDDIEKLTGSITVSAYEESEAV